MRLDHLLSKEKVESKNVFYCLAIKLKDFWCRCGWGTHPFPSRTRRLRPNRPMVLHWRRCGRAGGRQIKRKKQAKLPDKNRTGTGKWALLETEWNQKIFDKSGANPKSVGKDCYNSWFLPVIRVYKFACEFWWLIKHQSALYLENCIHEIWLS